MTELKFDYSKLRGRIIEKGLTLEQFSKKVDISRTALYKKLNKDGEFTDYEMFKICNLLEIPVENVSEYFFVQIVR